MAHSPNSPEKRPSRIVLAILTGRNRGYMQGAILFAISILAAIFGAFSMANRTPVTEMSVEKSKANATMMIKIGSDIKSFIDLYQSDRGSLEELTFNSDQNGLFNGSKGYGISPIGPANAYAGGNPTYVQPSDAAAGSYALHKSIKVKNVGTDNPEWVVLTVFFDLFTCQRINHVIAGISPQVAPPKSDLAASLWQTNAGSTDLPDAASGWREGCVEAHSADARGNKYVYFRVIREQ